MYKNIDIESISKYYYERYMQYNIKAFWWVGGKFTFKDAHDIFKNDNIEEYEGDDYDGIELDYHENHNKDHFMNFYNSYMSNNNMFLCIIQDRVGSYIYPSFISFEDISNPKSSKMLVFNSSQNENEFVNICANLNKFTNTPLDRIKFIDTLKNYSDQNKFGEVVTFLNYNSIILEPKFISSRAYENIMTVYDPIPLNNDILLSNTAKNLFKLMVINNAFK